MIHVEVRSPLRSKRATKRQRALAAARGSLSGLGGAHRLAQAHQDRGALFVRGGSEIRAAESRVISEVAPPEGKSVGRVNEIESHRARQRVTQRGEHCG